MRATRTLLVLVLVAVTVASGCSRPTSPVAPVDARRDVASVQTTSSDSTGTAEQRGVHTFGSGN